MILHRPHMVPAIGAPRYRDPHFQCLKHHLDGRAKRVASMNRSTVAAMFRKTKLCIVDVQKGRFDYHSYV